MQQQLRTRNRRRQHELLPSHRRNRADRAIRKTIRQRTQSDHDQQLNPIMFEHHSQRREFCTLLRHIRNVVFQHRPTEEERCRAAENRRRGEYQPAFGHAEHESSCRDAGAIPDHGRKGDEKRCEPEDEPAAGGVAPAFGDGGEVLEDGVAVCDGEDGEDGEEDGEEDCAGALEGGEVCPYGVAASVVLLGVLEVFVSSPLRSSRSGVERATRPERRVRVAAVEGRGGEVRFVVAVVVVLRCQRSGGGGVVFLVAHCVLMYPQRSNDGGLGEVRQCVRAVCWAES